MNSASTTTCGLAIRARSSLKQAVEKRKIPGVVMRVLAIESSGGRHAAGRLQPLFWSTDPGLCVATL